MSEEYKKVLPLKAADETAEEPKSIAPRQRQLSIFDMYSPTTKASKKLTDPDVYTTGLDLAVTPRKNKYVHVSLERLSNDVRLTKPINKYDQAVFDAVASLIVNNEAAFREDSYLDLTDGQIYSALSGGRAWKNASDLEEVNASMYKGLYTRAVIDFSEQVRSEQLRLFDDELASGQVDSPLIAGEVITLTTVNGKKVSGYRIYSLPALYKYGSAVKQIASYPQELLNVPDLKNYRKNVILKTYLLRRIEEMKHSAKLTNKIKYSTIFNEINEQEERDFSRNARKRLRNDVSKCLAYWKSKGEIADYEEYMIGTTVEGVEITVKPTFKKKPANTPRLQF